MHPLISKDRLIAVLLAADRAADIDERSPCAGEPCGCYLAQPFALSSAMIGENARPEVIRAELQPSLRDGTRKRKERIMRIWTADRCCTPVEAS